MTEKDNIHENLCLCLCGCGQVVTNIRSGKPHKYQNGHLKNPRSSATCLCGCGLPVSGYNYHKKRPVLFATGHSKRGEHNPGWKGGSYITKRGYRRILKPEHHRADIRGYVFEHIVVMEEKLGRELNDDEVVHHINGKKADNRPENLELIANQSMHSKLHNIRMDMSDRRCCDCGSAESYERWWFKADNGKFRCHACYHRLAYAKRQDKEKEYLIRVRLGKMLQK